MTRTYFTDLLSANKLDLEFKISDLMAIQLEDVLQFVNWLIMTYCQMTPVFLRSLKSPKIPVPSMGPWKAVTYHHLNN